MNKKRFSVFLAIMLVGIINLYSDAFAEYVTTIDAFEYKEYDIPAYDGDIYEYVNNNDPMFTKEEMITQAFETYSELDELGRCGEAYANICVELMPTGQRGEIGSVIPTGWIQNKYDIVSGKYLYNRSHLIGWQLTGEDANKENLITGTRQFNVEGMLPFENIVDDYFEDIDNENNHVLYRVTPIFDENNLLAKGVLMEAQSVEETEAEGGIEFCVFVYNVQDGIAIDYATGDNKLATEVDGDEFIQIDGCDIKLNNNTYTFTGKEIKPAVTVTYGDVVLEEGIDYTVSYKNNINAGTAIAQIEGLGKYAGTVVMNYTIKPRSITKLTFSKLSSKTFTGKKITPAVTIKYGSVTLKKNKDYTISYGKNVNPGIGTIVIKGKGNYNGNKSLSFYIVPKKIATISTNATKTSITVKWSKHSGVTGYQIAYRKMGPNKYKYVNVKSNSKVLKGLSSKKYHQIKVRAYKKVNGKVLYGSWSGVKKVRTK